ncbi:DUF1549 and DUF1553 domain-containing protein [Gimesia panareensis]|uniref:Bacterial Ig-like domain (Group 2) n=1 Tax=Gimesia panareensis TaxID=2527978 RepID=A0A518A3G9_9PLAN|nr:DUF1549 and DUF1553 domain-containing protein [Gimesia panareensis]QDT26348.1 Bacterial Ig-like domain (group 2) [Gimesia panareensis]QDU49285.1 Bacterial Ig-like domain (group 2) [Gimesia panareensis]
MKLKHLILLFVLFAGLLSGELENSSQAAQLEAYLPNQAKNIELSDPDARQQLLITLKEESGSLRDVTREVKYQIVPAGIAEVSPTGYVRPLSNGTATITAQLASAPSIKIPVHVSSFEQRRPVSFYNDVIPQLTRGGCNSGACHGTPSGKNNFHLSLLGFEPGNDFEYITKESLGRRINPAAPETSLLLQKAAGTVPHGGGSRFKPDGAEIKLISRWIREGMHYDPEKEPTVTKIDIFPKDRVLPKQATQQLVVTAYFSDGTERDITRMAEYKPNQPKMSEVNEHGVVKLKDQTGTTSVMIRFQEHVAVFMTTIPLGQPTPHLPTPENFIDQHVFAKLKVLGLPPSERCDDSTFLRRVTLDITGRIPTLEQTKAFLADQRPDKRARKIDELLNSPGYADLFASKWAGILRNKAGGNLEQVARETFGFHAWIRTSLAMNKPYNEFVTELVTARGKPGTNPAVSWYRAVKDPKDQMADIAQVFLGVRIQCAQCHHHPYEKWSQDDFYGFQAFFNTLGRKEVYKLPEDDIVYHKRIVAVAKNPNTDQELKPTPLDGAALEIPAERDPRIDLANWITDPQNPFFAKMLVNRYWKHFFGRGLVEPEDDIRITNPATHPELLNQLADSFVKSNYDLKAICRTICNSRTYQLSSFPNQYNQNDEQNYARYYPRRLPAEMMLDAMNDVAGARNNFNHQPVGIRAVALPDDSANVESFFLRVFGRPQMDTACECERTANADLAQSLHLINSDTMQQILSASDGQAVQLAREKTKDDQTHIKELYLHAFSRLPTQNELETGLNHLQKKRNQSKADPKKLSLEQAEKQAYEDIIWVMINTKEFLFNH